MARLSRPTLAGVVIAAVAIACNTNGGSFGAESIARAPSPEDRKVVRSGVLVLTVSAPEETSAKVEELVKQAGGFVEHSTATRDANIWIQCRIPAPKLDVTMDVIAALGDEERRSVSAADVTEQYSDLETRIRNNQALRDRLQQLLARATEVEHVLAIESELNRVQSEIEVMQARFDRLRSQVELSSLSVTLQPQVILGPLGYIGYGVLWVLSKLFVIR